MLFVLFFSVASALKPGAPERYFTSASIQYPGVPSVPEWPAVWQLNRSTVIMPCNTTNFLAQFGLVDFDWSNAKQLWANQAPMNCEELLVQQAKMIKEINPTTRVFVYRNIAKALPWFTGVRSVLTDPDYAGWFVPFKGGVPNNTYHVPQCTYEKCTSFYHDQDQTPEHPNGDGSCTAECDCGTVPCGEYAWDHRNASLRDYIINEHVAGPTGLGSPYIDGFYFDDGWSNKSNPILPWMPKEGFCDHSAIGGITEMDLHCSADMGLTQDDTTALSDAWYATMLAVMAKVVQLQGFLWQLFYFGSPPTVGPMCAAYFHAACSTSSPEFTSALFYTYSTNNATGKVLPLVSPAFDIASFLLVRGPYAWIGYGWIGCSSGSEPPGPGGGYPYEFPAALNADYGQPAGVCHEATGAPGTFVRQYSNAVVSLNCNTGAATLL